MTTNEREWKVVSREALIKRLRRALAKDDEVLRMLRDDGVQSCEWRIGGPSVNCEWLCLEDAAQVILGKKVTCRLRESTVEPLRYVIEEKEKEKTGAVA